MGIFKFMKRRASAISGKKDVCKRRTDTLSVDDTTLSHELEDAPWRVENFLEDGAPQAKDWWGTGGIWDADEGVEIDVDDYQDGSDVKVFRNCGFETWVRAQSVWRKRPEKSIIQKESKTRSSSTGRGNSSASILRRSQMKQLVDLRQVNLPRPIPLKDIITAYNGVWYDDAE